MNTEYITVTLAYIKKNGKRHHHSLFVFPKYYTFRMKQSDYKEVKNIGGMLINTKPTVKHTNNKMPVVAKIVAVEPDKPEHKLIKHFKPHALTSEEINAWQHWEKLKK